MAIPRPSTACVTFDKTLLIRADAGGSIGTGHVMRMVALAQAWQDRGGSVTLASVKCPEALAARLVEQGIQHRYLIGGEIGSNYDAKATLALATEINAAWIVTDGYDFGYDYQKRIKEGGFSLLCVDDFGYSDRWYCDAILNQNLDAERTRMYNNDVPNFKSLRGSDFCLLRKEFRNANFKKKEWGPINHLLITLGGSDPDNATEAVLELITAACQRRISVRVIAGVDNPHLQSLRNFETHHQIEVLTNITDMPAQYAWADGVISAGGSTCWEWLHAGLPGAIVTVAENQLPSVHALTVARKTAVSLGWHAGLNSAVHANSLYRWLEAPYSLANQSAADPVIDGGGAIRVATFLMKT